MEDLIGRFGVFAIFIGAAVEGEPFALAGGVFAHRGWMSLAATVPAAVAGAICIDQFWFHLSRNFRENRFIRRAVQRPAFHRALALFERHPVWFVFLFRFAYGLRAVAAVAIGLSKIPTRQFILLDILAASLWGFIFTGIGYFMTPAFETAHARYGLALTAATIALSITVLLLVVSSSRR